MVENLEVIARHWLEELTYADAVKALPKGDLPVADAATRCPRSTPRASMTFERPGSSSATICAQWGAQCLDQRMHGGSHTQFSRERTMDLQGKVAIVTGRGTGRGKAIAKLLAASGAHVVVNYSRSKADALATAKDLETNNVKALPMKADVSSAAEVAALVAQTERALGCIDVLVNRPGYTQFVAMRDLDGLSEEVWDRTFDVNVKGIWLCTKAVAPAMRRAGGGAVVNVTSAAGLKVGGSSMAYAVSKAAAIHLTKCLAFALAPEIRVNVMAPGLVVTRWWGHASEEEVNRMRASFPLKRSVEAEEVATAAMELIRNDAMTGQTLAQDAGFLLP
jgi:3-oxoacyl-[acyl-carrier protein] reductase